MQMHTIRASQRMSRLSYYSDRPIQQEQMMLIDEQEDLNVQTQPCILNWIKLIALFGFTYFYILLFFGMSYGTETLEDCSDGYRCAAQSYMAGGGIHLGFFAVYVIIFGVAWAYGSRQRERLKRQVVEKQLQRQRARQALMYGQQ